MLNLFDTYVTKLMPKVCTIFKRDYDRLNQKYKTTHKWFVDQRRKTRNLAAQLKRRDKTVEKLEKVIELKDEKIRELSKKDKTNPESDDIDDCREALQQKLNKDRPSKHKFCLSYIFLFINIYLSSSSGLRASQICVSASLELVLNEENTPHWKTCQTWVLKLGYYKLTNINIDTKHDWIWIIDHSIQLGTEKCFIVLGLRKIDVPRDGVIKKSDVQLLSMTFMKKSNGDIIDKALNELSNNLGVVPRQIISDEGADLVKGLKLFKKRHKKVLVTNDIKHKVANWYKAHIGETDSWKEFIEKVNLSRNKIQQTKLAALSPPKLRSKARFMNFPEMVKWASKILAMLTTTTNLYEINSLHQYFGWLLDYEEIIKSWGQVITDAMIVEDRLRRFHLTRYSTLTIEKAMGYPNKDTSSLALKFRENIKQFTNLQSVGLRNQERFLISTEVIESVMSSLKSFSQQHTQSGFTKMTLALPALIGGFSEHEVKLAMNEVTNKDVQNWVKDNISQSVQSERNKVTNWYKKHLKINDKRWFRLFYAA